MSGEGRAACVALPSVFPRRSRYIQTGASPAVSFLCGVFEQHPTWMCFPRPDYDSARLIGVSCYSLCSQYPIVSEPRPLSSLDVAAVAAGAAGAASPGVTLHGPGSSSARTSARPNGLPPARRSARSAGSATCRGRISPRRRRTPGMPSSPGASGSRLSRRGSPGRPPHDDAETAAYYIVPSFWKRRRVAWIEPAPRRGPSQHIDR